MEAFSHRSSSAGEEGEGDDAMTSEQFMAMLSMLMKQAHLGADDEATASEQLERQALDARGGQSGLGEKESDEEEDKEENEHEREATMERLIQGLQQAGRSDIGMFNRSACRRPKGRVKMETDQCFLPMSSCYYMHVSKMNEELRP